MSSEFYQWPPCERCLHHIRCHFINDKNELCCSACGGCPCRRTTHEKGMEAVVPR